MLCIYCGSSTDSTTSREHIVPATLGIKETLPKGYVCDKCNQYFSELDRQVILNRWLAMYIGTAQIPNRKGKIRQKIGNNLGFNNQHGLSTIKMEIVEREGNRIVFSFGQDKDFDELLFARGIYKIAFNCFACLKGYDEVQRSRYDNVKRYIRSPKPGELWPYVAGSISSTNHCQAKYIKKRDKQYIRLHLYRLDFIVCMDGPSYIYDPHHPDLCIVKHVGQWQGKTPIGLTKA